MLSLLYNLQRLHYCLLLQFSRENFVYCFSISKEVRFVFCFLSFIRQVSGACPVGSSVLRAVIQRTGHRSTLPSQASAGHLARARHCAPCSESKAGSGQLTASD